MDLTFKVTVEFICPNMIDDEVLREKFNNDPMSAYKWIAEDDNPYSFSESTKVTKVQIVPEQS